MCGHQTKQALEEHPLEAMKKLIWQTGINMQEVAVYSFRRVAVADGATIAQAMMKIPITHKKKLLLISGKGELYVFVVLLRFSPFTLRPSLAPGWIFASTAKVLLTWACFPPGSPRAAVDRSWL